MEKTLFESLMAVQAELKAPKDQHNRFGDYDYRSCERILEALKPLLSKHRLVLTLSDEVISLDGDHYVKATATIHNENGSFSNASSARESKGKKGMDDSQTTGSASSYARKYALNGLFAIDDAKDSDTDEYQKQTQQKDTDTDENSAKAQAMQEPAKAAIICQACGKPIVGLHHRGEDLTPEQIAKRTNKKYERTLCLDCASKIKPKENA